MFGEKKVQVLARFATEVEAAVVTNMLAESGIPSQAVGGYTSGFRAEAPGEVTVLVRETDFHVALEILRNANREAGNVNWDNVDVGDPE